MRETAARPLTDAEKLSWLRLIRSENVGPVTFFRLLRHFGSAEAALEGLPHLARRGGRRGEIRICPRDNAEREIAALSEIGATLLAWGEPAYPPLLAHIADPPPVISVLGHAELLGKASVAIVGARNASLAGQRFARELARGLGEGGLLVVSGMARGIDAAAHNGALETGSAAILGGGIDVPYPAENEALYGELREKGVLVSEVEPGTTPRARHFPRRNRIISGIVRGVVVVEASPRSGSLITARMALEQGREVFSVPGSPLDPRSRGTNRLIREGANLTESAEDVLTVLGERMLPLAEPPQHLFPQDSAEKETEQGTDSDRVAITEYLGPVPVTVDELIRNGQFSPAAVSRVLLELELAGRLERHPGNQVSLISRN